MTTFKTGFLAPSPYDEGGELSVGEWAAFPYTADAAADALHTALASASPNGRRPRPPLPAEVDWRRAGVLGPVKVGRGGRGERPALPRAPRARHPPPPPSRTSTSTAPRAAAAGPSPRQASSNRSSPSPGPPPACRRPRSPSSSSSTATAARPRTTSGAKGGRSKGRSTTFRKTGAWTRKAITRTRGSMASAGRRERRTRWPPWAATCACPSGPSPRCAPPWLGTRSPSPSAAATTSTTGTRTRAGSWRLGRTRASPGAPNRWTTRSSSSGTGRTPRPVPRPPTGSSKTVGARRCGGGGCGEGGGGAAPRAARPHPPHLPLSLPPSQWGDGGFFKLAAGSFGGRGAAGLLAMPGFPRAGRRASVAAAVDAV